MEGDKITDTLDIVAHSFGYAYALGMVEAKGDDLPRGRFYIIAPENASAGKVNPMDWQQVWQYGSDENDPLEKQDGVAPQTKISGLEEIEHKSGRAYIPDNEPKGFVTSHLIKNYVWIFTLGENDAGFLKPRK